VEEILRASKAVADRNRIRILRILTDGPFHVAELTGILGLGQSSVSRHLRILKDAGLVTVRRAGTWAFYSSAPAGEDSHASRLLGCLREEFAGADSPDLPAVERALAERRRETSAFFREIAPEYEERRAAAFDPTAHMDALLEVVGRAETLVDLGTGTGLALRDLARVSARLIGVDESAEMLGIARRRIDARELPEVDLRLGALEHLPLSDGEADVMVANLVLQHIADVRGVLPEIRRGLAAEGRLVIADLAEHGDEDLRETLGARWPGFSPPQLVSWLREAGFTRVTHRLVSTDSRSLAGPDVVLMEAMKP
jgi:ArsR family transcriptional regulator